MPETCPHCQSAEVRREVRDMHVSGDLLAVDFVCLRCNTTWHVVRNLADLIEARRQGPPAASDEEDACTRHSGNT